MNNPYRTTCATRHIALCDPNRPHDTRAGCGARRAQRRNPGTYRLPYRVRACVGTSAHGFIPRAGPGHVYRLTLTSSFAINKLLTKRPRLRAVRHHSPRRVSSGSNAQWCLCAARLTTLCGRPAAYEACAGPYGSALCSTLWHGLLAPRKNALGHIHSLRGQRRGMVAAARRLSPRSSVIRKRGALQLVQPIRCCKQL